MSDWIVRLVFFGAVGFGAFYLGWWGLDYGHSRVMDADDAIDALVERDNRRAFYALERLSQSGDPEANFGLGFAYLYGRGVESDVRRGEALLNGAAKDGVAGAAIALGNHHRRWFQDSDGWYLGDSLPWYLRAAELGEPRGMLGAGVAYLQLGGADNTERARELLEQAAEKGEVFAGFHLGEAYRDGRFGKVDNVQAAKWYAEGGLAGDYHSLRYAVILLTDDTLESFDPETAYFLSVIGHNWWPNANPRAIVFPWTARDVLYTTGPSPDVFLRRNRPSLALFYRGIFRVEHRLLSVPRLPPELRPALPESPDMIRSFNDATLLRIEAEANEIIASRPRPSMPQEDEWYDCICPPVRVGPNKRPHYWLWAR